MLILVFVAFSGFNLLKAQTVFEEDFLTWQGWNQYSSGNVEHSDEQSRSQGYSLKKTTNNDPNGGWKALDATIGREFTFEGWIYRPGDAGGGGQDRISIADANFNGYGLRVSGTIITIEKRTNGASDGDIAATPAYARPDDEWYRFVFVSNADNTFTFSVYNEADVLQASVTSSADTDYNVFDRIVIHGGHHFYVDDVSVVSVNPPLSTARLGGPAGVGNRMGDDDQPQLAMWLDAASLDLDDEDDVSAWYDLSGSGHHATQSTTANMPVWLENHLNDHPAVRFRPVVGAERTETWLNFNGDFLVGTPYSIFSVVARRDVIDTWDPEDPNPNIEAFIMGGSESSNNTNLQWGWRDEGDMDGNFSIAQWGNDIYVEVPRDNDFHVVSATRNDSGTPYNAALFYNGQQTTGLNTTLLSSYDGARIGSRAEGNHYSKIDLAEHVIYTDFLNPAQRIIVDNYMAFKYDLTLDEKQYHFTSGDSNYDQDFIGVGHAYDDYKQTQNAEGTGGALYISEAHSSFDEDDEYVFAAHDGTAHGTTTNDISNPNIVNRWERDFFIYRIQNGTPDGGTTSIQIGFDFEEAGISIQEDKYYYLVYRAGTAGDYDHVSGAIASATPGNSIIRFTLGDGQFNTGYYTIAETDLEPVEEISRGGPAGIGNDDGSNGQPRLVMWLDATRMELDNNDKVSLMTDFSGNNNHAEQPIPANQPTFLTGGTGGFTFPVVSFNPVNEEFLPFDGSIIVNSDYTFSFVGARRSNNARRIVIGGTATSANQNLHVYFQNSDNFRSHHYGNDLSTSFVNTAEPHSGGTEPESFGIFTTLLESGASSDQRRNYQNNDYLGSRTDNTRLSAYAGAAFARYTPAAPNYNDIEFSEAVFYSDALNDAQLIILNNYLHYKYDIEITNKQFTPPAAYVNNVIGMGRTDHTSQRHVETTGMGGGLYLGEANNTLTENNQFVFSAHSGTPLSMTDSDLPAEVEERQNRNFYIQRIQGGVVDAGTTDIRIGFDFEELNMDVENNIYYLLYRSGSSGDYVVVPGGSGLPAQGKVWFSIESNDFESGYYTIGRSDEIPVTWYSYKTGPWSDWETWGLDPDGSTGDNPGEEIPSENDRVVIRPSTVVTADINDIRVQELEVRGVLNLVETTGHNFGSVWGEGRIRLRADNFSIGNVAAFVSSEGGTVEYYGNSYELNSQKTYNNLDVNMTGGQTLTMMADQSLNGNLRIQNGTFRINDDDTEQILNLDIKGNLEVSTNGLIRVGEGDTRDGYSIQGGDVPGLGQYHSIFHQIVIEGDFINNGSVRFTNLDGPVYNEFADDGAATFILAGSKHPQNIELNGTTDFYNLIINKGSDKTYIAEVYSSHPDNFSLYGPNSIGRRTGGAFTAENPEVRKALWIRNGTLKFTGSIRIPSLTEGNQISGNGDYPIGANAQLWIAGGDVEIYTTISDASQLPPNASGEHTGTGHKALSLYGTFRISNGFFGTRNSAGFIFWPAAAATVMIEGGVVDVAQYRSAHGSGGDKTYHYQTGGELRVRGNRTYEGQSGGEPTAAYPLFGITLPQGVFQMSGGTITMVSRLTNDDFHVSAQDYSVTGGKLHLRLQGGDVFVINSVANLWDVEMERLGGGGNVNVRFINELTVSNDLTVNEYTHLHAREDDDAATPLHDLNVGRHFILDDNAEYIAWNGIDNGNITSFIGSENGELRLINNSDNNIFNVFDLLINKASQDADVIVVSEGRATADLTDTESPINILNSFRVLRGIFDYDRFSLRSVSVGGDITIENRGTIGRIDNDGYLSVNIPEILVPHGTTPVFGRLLIDYDGTVAFTGGADFIVGDLHMREGIVDIGTRSMTVYNEIHDDQESGEDFGLGKYIRMEGNHGDGGLIRRIYQDGDYIYPIGTEDRYAYAWPVFSDYDDEGYVQINAVPNKLPTMGSPTGGGVEDRYLNYYWRVRHNGFTGDLPTVNNRFLSNEDDYNWSWDHTLYVAGKVIDLVRYPSDAEGNEDYGEVQAGVSSTRLVNYWDFELEEGEFTVAFKQFFHGSIVVYYSYFPTWWGWYHANNDWTRPENWSKTPHGEPDRGATSNDGYPGPGDIAVLGRGDHSTHPAGGLGYHSMNIRGISSIECAQIIFDGARLVVDEGATLTVGIISGDWGTMMPRISAASRPDITADFSEFAQGNGTFNYWLQSSGEGNINRVQGYTQEYPNLRIEGGANRISTIEEDFIVNRNMTIDGDTEFRIHGGAEGGNVIVREQLRIGGWQGGTFSFNTSGEERTVEAGSILLREGYNKPYVIRVLNSSENNLVHRLMVHGNITQGYRDDGAVNLFTNNTGGNNVIIEFIGEDNASFERTGGQVPNLYRVIHNKDNPENSFTFNTNFTLGAPTDTETPPLEIQKGTLILNHGDIDITLSSNEDYTINAKATLQVENGTIRLSDDANLELEGNLVLDADGVAVFDQGGSNSSILYSATGGSRIYIGGNATLDVGSHICSRNADNTKGLLRYQQTGGIVNLGTVNPDRGDKGILEVFNPGSEFTLSGGEIHILQSKGAGTRADLYLETTNYNVNDVLEIVIGSATAEDETITINAGITPLPSLSVLGTNVKAQLRINGLQLLGSLNVTSGNSFDATDAADAGKKHNVWIEGDITNRGVAAINTDALFMQGVQQNILGDLILNDWVVDAANYVSLDAVESSSVTVNEDLHLVRGELRTNSNDVAVKKDVYNYGDFVGVDPDNGGLILNGTGNQNLYGDGSFARLEINKSAGQAILNGHLSMDNNLVLTNGNLSIGNYSLTLAENSIITGGEYGSTRMITTSGSLIAGGLIKNIAAGSGSFTFPLGVGGKYTPVVLDYTASSNPATIRVRPVNDAHPSTYSIDPDPHVLHYYWMVNTTGISGFIGDLTFQYNQGDVNGDEEEYLAARLLDDEDATWQKFPSQVDHENNEFFISFTSVNSLVGEYTAGVDDHIPPNVPLYISTGSGLWTEAGNWIHSVTGDPAPLGGPLGARVEIEPGHIIEIPDNSRLSYRTIINGRLDINSTDRHNLGTISGNGTLALSTGVLPGGDLAAFMQTAGSTVEYYGDSDIDISANYDEYQNLVLKGSGKRELPSTATPWNRIYGNLDIEENVDFVVDGWLEIRGDLTIDDGPTYDVSNWTYFVGGAQPQTITGNFTGDASMYRFYINKTGSYVSIDGSIDVDNLVYLRRGIINVPEASQLRFLRTSAFFGSSDFDQSWIDGRLTRRLTAGSYETDDFDNLFPISKNGKRRFVRIDDIVSVGSQDWTVEYFDTNPDNEGMDPELMDAELERVSAIEYWSIDGPDGGEAKVQLNWGAESGIGDAPGDEDNIVVALWDEGENEWTNLGNSESAFTDEDNLTGYVISDLSAPFSTKYFTLATTDENNSLPVELLHFTAEAVKGNIHLQWATASEINNDFFTIQRSKDGENWQNIKNVPSKAEYGFSNSMLFYGAWDNSAFEGLSYYRLKQTDFDGSYEYSDIVSVNIKSESIAKLNLFPNPNRGDRFYLNMTGFEPYEIIYISILDVYGKVLHSEVVKASETGSKNHEIIPHNLDRGVYFVITNTRNGRRAVRMIVQ